nr:hypothetical protein [Tanacetum cinerariifolium]
MNNKHQIWWDVDGDNSEATRVVEGVDGDGVVASVDDVVNGEWFGLAVRILKTMASSQNLDLYILCRYHVRGTVGANLRRARSLGQVVTTCEEPWSVYVGPRNGRGRFNTCEEPCIPFHGLVKVADKSEIVRILAGQIGKFAAMADVSSNLHILMTFHVISGATCQPFREEWKNHLLSPRNNNIQLTFGLRRVRNLDRSTSGRGTVEAGLRRARNLGLFRGDEDIQFVHLLFPSRGYWIL